jgi:hypothetical protein
VSFRTVCHVIGTVCHVITVRSATSALYGLYGQVQSASQNFACLARRTECDIFLIRTPFAIKIIPPESGRRAGRHGVGFVGIRALSFLSIFHALTGSWIRFRITYGVTKTRGDQISTSELKNKDIFNTKVFTHVLLYNSQYMESCALVGTIYNCGDPTLRSSQNHAIGWHVVARMGECHCPEALYVSKLRKVDCFSSPKEHV